MEVKKKRSFWESISDDPRYFTVLQSLILFALTVPLLIAFIPGCALIACIITGVYTLIVVIKFVSFTIKSIQRFICANKIVQKLPLSEEELKENHITTAEEYLQFVYKILQPIPMSYWYEDRFDYGDDPIIKEMSQTYHSFAEKENVCHNADDCYEEDSDIDLFVWLLCCSCCSYQSVDCDKCKRNANVFVPKKEL